MVMNDRDKGIYNFLGSSSSLAGIVSSNVSANTAPYFIIAFCNPDCKLNSMKMTLKCVQILTLKNLIV